MTFHQRVEEAAAFAAKLPETAAELYATEASDQALQDAATLPPSAIDAEFYELEPFRHVPPDRVWAQWLCGDHLVSERREVIWQFAGGINAAGRRVHRAFLASVRVLGEGVDIVGERGVGSLTGAVPSAGFVRTRTEDIPGRHARVARSAMATRESGVRCRSVPGGPRGDHAVVRPVVVLPVGPRPDGILVVDHRGVARLVALRGQ
jgi:hypothetical protein